MPYQLPNGRTLPLDVAWEYDGVSYPANFLRLSTQLDRDRLGIVWVADAPAWDQRFWWGYDADGNLIPKDHGQLVEQWSNQTRVTAGTLLAPTDWLIIREADNGTAPDPALKTWRQDIRLATGTKIAAIVATTDTAELAAYVTGANYYDWPVDPTQPQPDPAPLPDDPDGLQQLVNDGSSVDQVFG